VLFQDYLYNNKSLKQEINMKQNRRKFIGASIALGAGMAASALPLAKQLDTKVLIHHVFFWLKSPSSKEDLKKLIVGLKTLENIESVRKIHIGVPASTEKRDVVDNSYSASEILYFDDTAGQKIYQDHPIHKKFVEDCSGLWQKVIVYDAIDV
jgi:hypothetical protein